MKIKTGIGQDSHKFIKTGNKTLVLGGIAFLNHKGLQGNSDADVILHSLTNAISSVSGNNILGAPADKLCKKGIIDSKEYVKLALRDLTDYRIEHIAICIECLTPKITPQIHKIKLSIASLVKTSINNIGITASTGEGLNAYGQGKGIKATSIITVSNNNN